jgi:hypothetical protein
MKREFLLAILLTIPAYSVSANDGNEILLKSRHFIPQRGITADAKAKIEAVPQRAHVLIQLERAPTIDERKDLEAKGVKLLSYIPNKTWFASIPSDKTNEIVALSNVRAISEILPEDKIDRAIRQKGINSYSTNENGEAKLVILFFPDVSLSEASSIITSYGGTIKGQAPVINALVVYLPKDLIYELAAHDTVSWIDQHYEPSAANDGSRAVIGVNIVQSPPYNLTGTGIMVGEWDGGCVDAAHGDLTGRVTWTNCGGGYDPYHATHVAGTMLGNGSRSESAGGTPYQWKGMAPDAAVVSYLWWEDDSELDSNYYEAIHTYHIDLSTNSWGFFDWDCEYDSHTQAEDFVVIGSQGKIIPIIWAAGNEGNLYGWMSLRSNAVAKNIITVGATNSNDNSLWYRSSLGPTADGRVKPDVVAPGCEIGGDNGITSTLPGNTYGVYCGTSMATPAVAGSVALMLEEWRNIHPDQFDHDPLPSTIKAVLIQTALDLGNTGPDYSYGYGKINVNDAIDLISEDINDVNGVTNISEDPIRENRCGVMDCSPYNHFTITVPQNQPELRITLVWDDTPGQPNPETSLVNDLDLTVKDPDGTRYYPWVLDRYNPAEPATRGTDHINNVEQVCIDNPVSGAWTIDINWTGYLSDPYQPYSLVWSCPKFFHISKVDDVNNGSSVLPGDAITYTIYYSYPWEHNIGDINDVNIIDYLPLEVEPNDPCDPNYDAVSRTYIWNLGTLSPGETNSVTLKVTVNNLAEPLGTIKNLCAIRANVRGNGIRSDFASEITDVNAWSPPVIYVDRNATGRNTGMRWQDAYPDLQKALDKAGNGCGSSIWVAAGPYIPGPSVSSTFQLVAGVPVYGHFAGNETSLSQRNLNNPANETILITRDSNSNITNIVTAASNLSQNNILDGFTITGLYTHGVKIEDANLTVNNCLIDGSSSSGSYGIYANDSNFTIANCVIRNNYEGIYVHVDSLHALPKTRIENCLIRNNRQDGIYLRMYGSLISIRNNTIVSNSSGINCNDGNTPNVTSCIIWGNSSVQLPSRCSANYSCIQYYSGSDTNDINSDPYFVDADSKNFHLKPNSPCIDKGDPCFTDSNDKDIDGEPRIFNGRVDMGADEFDESCRPRTDFNHDDIVNFIDFAMFATSWATAEGEQDYNDLYDLEDDNVIDIHDLAQFCDNWLWIAPWSPLYESLGIQSEGDMSMAAESSAEQLEFAEETSAEVVTDEQIESIDQPMSDEQIQSLIDWTQQLWQSDPNIRAMVNQADYERILESLKEQLNE